MLTVTCLISKGINKAENERTESSQRGDKSREVLKEVGDKKRVGCINTGRGAIANKTAILFFLIRGICLTIQLV